MFILNSRVQWLLFCLAVIVSVVSIYFEFGMNLLPCPLCIMQRLAIFMISLLLLFKLLISNKKARCILSVLALFTSLLGLFFASRQVYLQHLPPGQAPACGPSLDMLIQYFPVGDVLHALFYGTGDCAKVTWTFLGGSIAFWSMLLFALFVFVFSFEGFYLAKKKK